jgi:polyphenol oxidase
MRFFASCDSRASIGHYTDTFISTQAFGPRSVSRKNRAFSDMSTRMISVLQFEILSDISGLRHAVSTRSGGQSEKPYLSLNLGYHVGDDPENVSRNREILARYLGYEAQNLVAAQQVHGDAIFVADASTRGRGAFGWNSAIPDCDALLTRENGVPLLIQVADCAPLILVDENAHFLAVVHAGWRGAVARIASQTVEKMQTLGAQPQNIKVGIGPCLCADCFEVGDEVVTATNEIAPDAMRFEYSKPHLDLRELLRHDLQSAGIMSTHIETMNRCPRCENEVFFSHRGDGGETGRFGLVAWWELG